MSEPSVWTDLVGFVALIAVLVAACRVYLHFYPPSEQRDRRW